MMLGTSISARDCCSRLHEYTCLLGTGNARSCRCASVLQMIKDTPGAAVGCRGGRVVLLGSSDVGVLGGYFTRGKPALTIF
jgi:hypothetical protein